MHCQSKRARDEGKTRWEQRESRCSKPGRGPDSRTATDASACPELPSIAFRESPPVRCIVHRLDIRSDIERDVDRFSVAHQGPAGAGLCARTNPNNHT